MKKIRSLMPLITIGSLTLMIGCAQTNNETRVYGNGSVVAKMDDSTLLGSNSINFSLPRLYEYNGKSFRDNPTANVVLGQLFLDHPDGAHSYSVLFNFIALEQKLLDLNKDLLDLNGDEIPLEEKMDIPVTIIARESGITKDPLYEVATFTIQGLRKPALSNHEVKDESHGDQTTRDAYTPFLSGSLSLTANTPQGTLTIESKIDLQIIKSLYYSSGDHS